MHVLERAYFGISIEFVKINGQVTDYKKYWFNNPYDLTLSLINKDLSVIDSSEIERLHPSLEATKIDELTRLVNELVVKLKTYEDKDAYEYVSNDLMSKLARFMPVLLSTSSSMVTLIDSYKNAGAIGELLTSLVKLFG
jgi:hypothetical protein